MGQNKNQQLNRLPNNSPVSVPQVPQLDPETIRAFVESQHLELQNEAMRLKIREKELDVNASYAKESLKLQAAYLDKKPEEERKTITRIAWIVGGFAVLLLGFVVFCLMYDEREFITKVLKGLSYLATTGLGYYFGQRNKDTSKPPSDTPNAQVVSE